MSDHLEKFNYPHCIGMISSTSRPFRSAIVFDNAMNHPTIVETEIEHTCTCKPFIDRYCKVHVVATLIKMMTPRQYLA